MTPRDRIQAALRGGWDVVRLIIATTLFFPLAFVAVLAATVRLVADTVLGWSVEILMRVIEWGEGRRFRTIPEVADILEGREMIEDGTRKE